MVSILMPVKNASAYLDQCIESISAQTYKNWELIAINDHSTDDSLEKLYHYSSLDKRIKVSVNDGTGIIMALRKAYSMCQGQYVTRMDSDDYMPSNKLALMRSELMSHGRNYLATGLVKYVSETTLGNGYLKYQDWLNKLTSSSSNFSEIYKECSIPSPCWMIHIDDLEKSQAFDSELYPEDYDLAFRFRAAQLKVIGINEVLHYWRDYSDRTSRNDPHYSDNLFVTLKVHHFLKQDHEPLQPLLLWGAGKKAKKIAQELIERKIEFHWLSNNPKKIGKDIYGNIILDESQLGKFKQAQVIVSVSSPSDMVDIRSILSEYEGQSYWFC